MFAATVLALSMSYMVLIVADWLANALILLAAKEMCEAPHPGHVASQCPMMFRRNERRNEGTFGCSPGTKNQNEGTFACSPGTKTGTRVH